MTYEVTPTDQYGIHTGRRRYRVRCTSCGVLVHEATTGPIYNIESHERIGCERWKIEMEGP